jgi:integrase
MIEAERKLALRDQMQQLSMASGEAAARRPISELVEELMAAAGRSEHTRRAYRTAVAMFLRFLEGERGQLVPNDLEQWKPFAEARTVASKGRGRQGAPRTEWVFNPPGMVLRLVDGGSVDRFRAWRESEGDSPNTASARTAAVRSFLSVALRAGVLTVEQGQHLGIKPYRQRQVRDLKPVGRRLTSSEVRALRSVCKRDSIKGKRDLAMIDAMLFLGLRREEVSTLKIEDFRLDGGRWWVHLQGKGRKTRRLKVHDLFYRSVTEWLANIDRSLSESTGPVFLNLNRHGGLTGHPVNGAVVARIVAELGAEAGLASPSGPSRLSPHDLRRTAARNAFDNGADLLLIQQWLGHSDPKTTAHYIGSTEHDDNTAGDFIRY